MRTSRTKIGYCSYSNPGFEDQQRGFSFVTTPRLCVRPDQCDRLQAGGRLYIADFITPQEELALLDAIDKESWLATKRYTQGIVGTRTKIRKSFRNLQCFRY